MPPLTFLKAKKIDSIRYPYGIQTISTSNNQGYKQTRLPIRQRNNKGREATKGYKRTPETTKARNRRQRQTTEKAADKKIRFGETTSPQGG